MKPYQAILIQECDELLVAIPVDKFAIESPHPYQKLGAKYQEKSPYYLRQNVLNSLIDAQNNLQQLYPGWKIKIFDAYRPIEVQKFMVDYTFASIVNSLDLKSEQISTQQQENIWQQVYKFWSVPNYDPCYPPPHSTGAAIDLTLVDADGETLDMGSEIDELSDRSHPNYYATSNNQREQQYHHNRQLLFTVMKKAGFCRHPDEWWHFSVGDQMWAWQQNILNPEGFCVARYGRVIL